MKKRLPAIITALLLAVTLLFFAARPRLKTAESSFDSAQPESVIWRMSDAARAGDPQAYLDCFTGGLRRKLEQTVSDMGEREFGQYLKRMNDELTGIAVADLMWMGENSVKLSVEFVFPDKLETQRHYLIRRDGAWRIEQVDEAERVK
jgi:hypothetical protein